MPNTEQSLQETGGIPVIEMSMQVNGMTQTAVDKSLTVADMAADAKAVGDRFAANESDFSDLAADVSDIQQWTGEDLPLNTAEGAKTIAEAVKDNADEIEEIKGWSGEDIPLSNTPGSSTIAEAFGSIISESYPVGSIYMTTQNVPPLFSGTWVEIGITATWSQLKTGKRDYTELESGDTGGTVHFWLRTE